MYISSHWTWYHIPNSRGDCEAVAPKVKGHLKQSNVLFFNMFFIDSRGSYGFMSFYEEQFYTSELNRASTTNHWSQPAQISANQTQTQNSWDSVLYATMAGFSGFFQVEKGKKWIFPGDEKQELPGILPERHAILRVKILKTLFLSNISGGGSRS